MLDPKFIDDITRRLTQAMPASARALQDDLEKNLRAAMQSVFARMDLVTREEFDVQTRVLARSRDKIEALEKQVAALEEQLLKKGSSRSRSRKKTQD
jgi:BMFP domain-containing protein YqiC